MIAVFFFTYDKPVAYCTPQCLDSNFGFYNWFCKDNLAAQGAPYLYAFVTMIVKRRKSHKPPDLSIYILNSFKNRALS